MKRHLTSIFFFFFSLVYLNSNAQELGVIDNKGTRKNINKVTKNNTGIKPSTNVYSGDVYIDELNGEVFIYDGKNSVWESFTQYWSLKGNSGLTNDNFLGTIDDVKLQLRSENKTILELGKRSTLGLSTSIFGDDPLAHIKNGGSNYSTIQFEAANISAHGKPMIRASADNFVIRSGIPTDDYFQIRSVANSATDGSLEFEIGDDGNEPFVFKSQNNSFGGTKELFRVQGNDTSTDSKPRFGINTNGTMANSTLEIEGSVSKSIIETTANLTLTEDHHTVVLGGNHNITLPAANTCTGRIYIIKNTFSYSSNLPTITNYINTVGTSTNIIPNSSVLQLQSDGTNWTRINNESNLPQVFTGSFIISYTNNGSNMQISLPFEPSQITFVAHANIESKNIDGDGQQYDYTTNTYLTHNNDNAWGISNSFGTMRGFARNDLGTTIQEVIYIGGSGNSINDISRYSSDSNCIGLRYSNQDGISLGKITANLVSFDTNGFTIRPTYTNGNETWLDYGGTRKRLVRPQDIRGESILVLFTAYK